MPVIKNYFRYTVFLLKILKDVVHKENGMRKQ